MKSAFAIICARGGSKGLKNKNLRKINGLSLVAHSVLIAKKIKIIKKIIVSTDSKRIADEAIKYGAEVPELRPKNLSGDTTPEWKVWKYLINLFINKKYLGFNINKDFIISLPPTAPLRSKKDIINGIKVFNKDKPDALISVYPSSRSPYFNMVKKEGKYFKLVIKPKKNISRRQDAPITYDMTTVLFIAKPQHILKKKNLFDGKVSSVIVSKKRALDIDDYYDLSLARKFAND